MDLGLVHRVVCPFTPQLSLVLINRPCRDGTLSWRWYIAATGGSRTHDLAIAKSGTVPLGHRVPKSNNLSLNEAIDMAENRPLWRLMSTSGATYS